MSETIDEAPPALRMATRAARAEPATLDAEAREVEVIFSTGARAINYVPGEGICWEELDMSAGAIRMGMLNSGTAPVLDSHDSGEVEHVLGRVVSARLERGVGVARLKFSGADDVLSTWQKVQDGTLRTVSVGYKIHGYEKSTAKDGRTLVRVTDWEPYEISVVAIPADPGAVFRAALDVARAAEIDGEAAADASETAVAETTTETPALAGSGDRNMAEATPAAPVADAVDVEAVRAAAITAERARVNEIDAALAPAVTRLGADGVAAIRSKAIADGSNAEAARAMAFDLLVKQSAPIQTAHVDASGDDPVAIRDAMAEALVMRMKPKYKPANQRAVEYRGVRFSDMVRELMTAQGERNLPRNPVAFAERAFHSTSDFPLLLSSALNKVLLADYAQAAPTYRMFMAQRTFNDFRAHSFLRAGDFPTLETLLEGGEIKTGTISEGREQVTLATYAKGVRVTRQMLVNDDLGAFTDFGGMIGRRVVDFENALAFSTCITAGSGAGPNLADGNAVFTTTRGNRSASGAAIDVTTLSTARAALRGRTSPDGLKLNLSPRYLLTGPAYETIAWQYTSAQYVPATAGTTNPFRGVYEPIVDANITGNNWYLFADPAVAPVFIYGYLDGAAGPQVRTTNPLSTDGAVQVDVWMDFGVGAIDWRGGYFNAGA